MAQLLCCWLTRNVLDENTEPILRKRYYFSGFVVWCNTCRYNSNRCLYINKGALIRVFNLHVLRNTRLERPSVSTVDMIAIDYVETHGAKVDNDSIQRAKWEETGERWCSRGMAVISLGTSTQSLLISTECFWVPRLSGPGTSNGKSISIQYTIPEHWIDLQRVNSQLHLENKPIATLTRCSRKALYRPVDVFCSLFELVKYNYLLGSGYTFQFVFISYVY